MKWTKVITVFVVFLVLACGQKPQAQIDADGNTSYGENFEIAEAISVSEAIGMLETQDTISQQITGTVTAVCKAKGCWMNVVETEDGESFFVKFKDYGFFMPLDFEGTKIVMNGHAYTQMTPVDELRHYAEDAGKSAEEIAAITEPEMEYLYMASGVKVVE